MGEFFARNLMILYKYCCPKRLEPLKDQTLRITQFNQLNDPFDCLPVFSLQEDETAREEAWQHCRQGIFEKFKEIEGKGEITGLAFQDFVKRVIPNLEKETKERLSAPPTDDGWSLEVNLSMQATMSKKHGVVCLSKSPDSLLMWSHYADQHKGYVIGIDPCELELPLAAEATVGRFRSVNYQLDRVPSNPRRNDFDFLYAKSPHWAYEEEWRLVLRLNACRNSPTPSDIWVRDFGAQNLREIVVGFRAKDADLLREVARIKSSMPSVKIRRARPSAIHHSMILSDEHKDWNEINAGTTWTR